MSQDSMKPEERKPFEILSDEAMWQGLTPIPQADSERPMVPISYSPECKLHFPSSL